MAEESLRLAQTISGSDQRLKLLATHTLAWINRDLGRTAEAAQLFQTALPLCRSFYGELHPITGLDLSALGECYLATDRVAEAHRLLAAALQTYNAAPGDPRSRAPAALVRSVFGRTLLKEARFADAETELRRTLADYDLGGLRPLSLRMVPRPRAASALGQALAGQGKFAEAEPLAVQAFRDLQADERRIAGDRAGMVREALEAVITLYRAWGKPEKVAEWSAQLAALPAAAP